MKLSYPPICASWACYWATRSLPKAQSRLLFYSIDPKCIKTSTTYQNESNQKLWKWTISAICYIISGTLFHTVFIVTDKLKSKTILYHILFNAIHVYAIHFMFRTIICCSQRITQSLHFINQNSLVKSGDHLPTSANQIPNTSNNFDLLFNVLSIVNQGPIYSCSSIYIV